MHIDNKGIIVGLWKGDMNCIGPRSKRCGLRCQKREELHRLRANEILIEVQHVEAHRTEKERQRMSLFEKFITEGNEQADELAKRHEQVQSSRREKCTQVCSMQPVFIACWKSKAKWFFRGQEWRGNEAPDRVAAGIYRCSRCGRGGKYLKMKGKCTGPKDVAKNLGRWSKQHMRRHDMVKNGLAGRSFDLVQKMLYLCATKNGTKTDEPLQAGESGHKGIWKEVETYSGSCPAKEAREWKIEGRKRRMTRKEFRRL